LSSVESSSSSSVSSESSKKILSEQSEEEEEEYELIQNEVHSQYIRDPVDFSTCQFKELDTDLEHDPFKLAFNHRRGV